jgi:hypothetical protein
MRNLTPSKNVEDATVRAADAAARAAHGVADTATRALIQCSVESWLLDEAQQAHRPASRSRPAWPRFGDGGGLALIVSMAPDGSLNR